MAFVYSTTSYCTIGAKDRDSVASKLSHSFRSNAEKRELNKDNEVHTEVLVPRTEESGEVPHKWIKTKDRKMKT